MSFSWFGTAASLGVTGRDEAVAAALRDRAAAVLEAAALDPETPSTFGLGRPLAEEKTHLSLASVRFAGTYQDLQELVAAMAEQVRQVRNADLDFTYIALTEPGQTVTVFHLSELQKITSRDVKRVRHLSIALGSSSVGPSVSLFVRAGRFRNGMSGNVTGPSEAPTRALRAALNDLLRDRSRSPRWLSALTLSTAGLALNLLGLAAFVLSADLRPFALVPIGLGFLLAQSMLYLPYVELLAPGEKTRWSRWGRWVLGVGVAWLVGSLAIPVFDR